MIKNKKKEGQKKMKRVKKMIISILMIIIFLIPGEVRADSFNLVVTANKTYVKAGEEVELTLKISNIDVKDPGINTVEGYLKYDNSIFEEVDTSSIESLNNWSITYNSEETEEKGKFLGVIMANGVKEDQTIGKIKLKVKSGVKYTKTTITINGITSNNGEEEIKEEDKQIVLEVGTRNTSSSGGTEENTEGNNEEESGNKGNKEENMSTGRLPQTGVIERVYIAIATVVSIFAVTMYVRYKNIDK